MQQQELREWLVEHQENCPGCGCRSSEWHQLHHVFVRRLNKQIDDLTWVPQNCSLVCPKCHTGMGEAPDLNLNCTLQKFEWFTPDEIRDWMDSLPLKVKRGLPGFFLEAEVQWMTLQST